MEWKPIDTAPKDVPVIIRVVGYPWTTMGIWNEPSKKWCYVEL